MKNIFINPKEEEGKHQEHLKRHQSIIIKTNSQKKKTLKNL
jgi:hypothetical protein